MISRGDLMRLYPIDQWPADLRITAGMRKCSRLNPTGLIKRARSLCRAFIKINAQAEPRGHVPRQQFLCHNAPVLYGAPPAPLLEIARMKASRFGRRRRGSDEKWGKVPHRPRGNLRTGIPSPHSKSTAAECVLMESCENRQRWCPSASRSTIPIGSKTSGRVPVCCSRSWR